MKLSKRFFLMLFISLVSLVLISACSGDSEDTSSDTDSGTDSESASDFYDGETIEMVVPFDAGGGSDVLARYFAPFFSDHVEGNPTVQVINIPGSGSIIGANEYANLYEPNGHNVLWTSGSTAMNYLLQTDGVEYDYKDFSPIVGIPVGGVVYTSPTTGINEP